MRNSWKIHQTSTINLSSESDHSMRKELLFANKKKKNEKLHAKIVQRNRDMDSPMIVIEEWKIEGRKGRWRLIKNEQEDLYFFLFFTMAPISSCNRRITDRGGGRRLQKFIYNVQLNRVRTIQLGEHLIARRWPQPRTWDFQSFARPRWLVR